MSYIPPIPPEVQAAMYKLLASYGVPVPERVHWMYAQRELLASLQAAYQQLKKEKRTDR